MSIRVAYEEVKKNVKQAFLNLGLTEEQAETCATIHTQSSADGVESHGLNRIPRFVEYVQKGWVNIKGEPQLAGAKGFTEDIFNKACGYLHKNEGTVVDKECVDAFLQAFPLPHFLTLGEDSFEKNLWEKIPRIKQELSFAQIKELARFFAQIVDYKSPFTSTHSIGVAEDAERLSRYMGFDEETVQKMYLAGALHDIGKVAVGNEILEKPGRLTEDEFAVMKHHAAYTYYILSGVDDFDEIRDWAAFHHERLDGTGYPFGKTAAELNTQERMMACIDIYQALTESRPYKQGMPHEKACEILRDMANKGWLDETIVKQVEDCFRG